LTRNQYFSMLLCGLLAPGSAYRACWGQDAQPGSVPSKLSLVILEGEGAVNNVRQRVTREPVVQVEDENGKPVAGVSVVFLLPSSGASGTFADGSRMLTLLSDQNGRAAMRGFTPNHAAGKFEVRVTASLRGQTASTTINQTNAAAAAGGAGSGKLVGILAVAGAAAAAGAVAATRGGTKPGAPAAIPGATPASPATITPGTPVVGPPR